MFKKLSFLMMFVFVLVLVSGCGAGGGGANGESEEATSGAKAFYKNETVELLVPYSAGGGTDTLARFIAPFMNKHVEGDPKVQVVNVPGGGSVIGTNEFVKIREHNGLNALLSSGSTHFPYLLGEPAVKYDFKTLQPIIGFPIGGVVYVSPSTGVKSAQDLKDAEEQLTYAGISATGLDLVTLLAFEVLDLDVNCNLGYKGRGPSRVAFEQGESNIDYQTAPGYMNNVQPLIDEGKAVPVFSLGMLNENGELVRDQVFSELPTIKEVHQDMYGEAPSGPAWDAYKAFVSAGFSPMKVLWLHNDAPEKSIQALQDAAVDMKNDPQFGKKAEEILGASYEPLTGNKLKGAVNSMCNVSDESLEWVRSFLKDEYGVTRFEEN